MANGYRHYLEPEWLMQTPQTLLTRQTSGVEDWADVNYADHPGMLSEQSFKQQYYTGETTGGQGSGRGHYFDYSGFSDAGMERHEDLGMKFGGGRRKPYQEGDILKDITGQGLTGQKGMQKKAMAGYQFESIEDAYQAYQEHFLGQQVGTPLGQVQADMYNPDSFAAARAEAVGGEPGVSGTYPKVTPEDLRSIRTEYYQKDIEGGRGSLIDSLISKVQKAKAKGSGIAGYGKRDADVSGLYDKFGKGVEDIYEGIEGQRASALQQLYDSWGAYENITAPGTTD